MLGGSAAIGLCFARQRLNTLMQEGFDVTIILAARDREKLVAEKDDLIARGATVKCLIGDLSSQATSANLRNCAETLDEVVLVYGSLTDQKKVADDSLYLQQELLVNFVSAAVWLEHIARHFEAQGFGRAVVFGSVAGDRGRQSNYAYGAAKAGVETFVEGLQHRFAKTAEICFLLVKPGFVDTPMTSHISPKGFLWAKPERIASICEKALLKGRLMVYAPWFWRWIMLIIKTLPRFIFHRTSL